MFVFQMANQYETISSNLRIEQDKHLRTQQANNDFIVNEKQYRLKIVKLENEMKEKDMHAHDYIDSLQTQMKNVQKRLDQLTNEHQRIIDEHTRQNHVHHEHDEQLHDEIQRLKRDLGLELYRKQDAEKKARAFEDKLRTEQVQWQKFQFDFTKTKHDLKTLQVKYDALQLEMIDLHRQATMSHMLEAKTSTMSVNREKSVVRTKRRTNDESQLEQDIKKPKRVTRSQSTVSSANTSVNTCQHDEHNDERTSKRLSRHATIHNRMESKPLTKQLTNVGQSIDLSRYVCHVQQ
jgi:hypothetical protein